MSVWMDLLVSYFESVFYKIQMIDITEPDPRDISLLCNSALSVPLGFFPKVIRRFQITGFQSFIHIFVYGFVRIWRVLCKAGLAHCMIDVVQLHWCMCAPSPYKWLRLCSCVGGIPVNTLPWGRLYTAEKDGILIELVMHNK